MFPPGDLLLYLSSSQFSSRTEKGWHRRPTFALSFIDFFFHKLKKQGNNLTTISHCWFTKFVEINFAPLSGPENGMSTDAILRQLLRRIWSKPAQWNVSIRCMVVVVVLAVRQTGLKFGSRFLSLSKRASCHMGEEIRRKTKATCQFGTRPLILAVGCWLLMGGDPDRLVKSVRQGVAKSGWSNYGPDFIWMGLQNLACALFLH